jgi:D-xylono/L-arabinono-1,4-lactonase
MGSLSIEKIADPRAVVGEGTVWDGKTKTLYWTDIHTGRVFAYDPVSSENRQIHQGVNVGGLRVNRGGGLAFGTWEGVQLWRSDAENVWLHRAPELQFNDVTAGPDGSFYAGSYLLDRPGVLYRYFPNGLVEVVAEGLGISNGMGFSPDLRTFYHTDSTAREIYAYDYNPTTHRLGRRRSFAKIGNDLGVPDGMTVDAAGFVWSANWAGGCVIRFDPDGKEERRIAFPATQTSAVAFGGPDLTDLYVSTASNGTGAPPSVLEPAGYDYSAYRGGALFRVRGLDLPGKPEFETDLVWPA